MKKILRIFPRRTKATPTDANAIIGRLPRMSDTADEIRISVTFTWDIPAAERLYNQWRHVAPVVSLGGPAFNSPDDDFEPGMYLKQGYTITSRGCNNRCWFCAVWKRLPKVKELPIHQGHIIQDDNLLGCSEQHIRAVFAMLRKQSTPAVFSGGIEAKLLKPWHVELLKSIRLNSLFCAYDTPDDLEPLRHAGKLLNEANIKYENRKARCYVLIGTPGDTIEKAEHRLKQALHAGFFPFSMLYRVDDGKRDKTWARFHRQWASPIISAVNCKKIKGA